LPSISYLPYALQLTYLVEFFHLCPKPDIHQRHGLKEWFWKTSFTKHYGSANTGLITKDLAQIRLFAKGEIDKPAIEKKINYLGFPKETFILNKASSMTFALLLATRNPLSFLDGTKVDTYKALSYINKLEYHHIFPQAFLKENGHTKTAINYHGNICMLNLSNNREISDTPPSEYFIKIEKKLGDKLEKVLQSNFISRGAFEAGLADDYELFMPSCLRLKVETVP
jgi:hypothetical protein